MKSIEYNFFDDYETLKCNNQEFEIRFLGIDAPELKPCRKLTQDERETHLHRRRWKRDKRAGSFTHTQDCEQGWPAARPDCN